MKVVSITTDKENEVNVMVPSSDQRNQYINCSANNVPAQVYC